MDTETIYQQIRATIDSYFPGAPVMLFGSRARGDHNLKSDYDLLIVTPHTLNPQEKVKRTTELDKALVNALHIPVDILLNSEEEVKVKQELPGHIIRWAVKEGIAI